MRKNSAFASKSLLKALPPCPNNNSPLKLPASKMQLRSSPKPAPTPLSSWPTFWKSARKTTASPPPPPRRRRLRCSPSIPQAVLRPVVVIVLVLRDHARGSGFLLSRSVSFVRLCVGAQTAGQDHEVAPANVLSSECVAVRRWKPRPRVGTTKVTVFVVKI